MTIVSSYARPRQKATHVMQAAGPVGEPDPTGEFAAQVSALKSLTGELPQELHHSSYVHHKPIKSPSFTSMGWLKPLWGSKVEGLAGNARDLTANVNNQIGSHHIEDILSLGKDLAKSATFANYTSAFSTMYSTYKNKDAAQYQRAIAKEIEEANGKLSGIEEASTISANIEHQKDFGRSVYNFVSHQTKMNNDDNDTATTVAKADELNLNHYFFVLHPSNDWHPAFEEARNENQSSLPGFIGYTMDRTALGLYLGHMREAVGNKPTFHVLVPSAREYRLPGVVNVDPGIQPLIIKGQVTYSGRPYCSATILGLDDQYIESVENLPPPQVSGVRKGGFRATSEKVALKAPATLWASCKTREGTYKESSIDLDKLLGAEAGAFKLGGKDFSKRVTNTTLDTDGVTLRATISQPEGSSKSCAINLEAFISNDDGVLREYGVLSPAEKAKAGAKGTLGGFGGAAIGAIFGPPGMIAGAAVGATIIGMGAEEDYEKRKKEQGAEN